MKLSWDLPYPSKNRDMVFGGVTLWADEKIKEAYCKNHNNFVKLIKLILLLVNLKFFWMQNTFKQYQQNIVKMQFNYEASVQLHILFFPLFKNFVLSGINEICTTGFICNYRHTNHNWKVERSKHLLLIIKKKLI